MEEPIRAGRSIFLEGDEAGMVEEILDDENRCLDPAEDVDGLDEEGIESKSAMGDEERSSGAADLNGEEIKEDSVVKSGGKPGPKKRAGSEGPASSAKKPKKKTKNVWAKGWKRKAGKKANGKAQAKNVENENSVHITPVTRNMEKVEDGPEMPILLSKIHKAERVELSSDRLSAGSTKGYRMVRATRGVVEGAWYFEITLEKLGPTGHTRLGWCTQKGDVQAPVGYDTHGYSYRDVDGSKVHAALREPYGEQYMEGDVIGFYINLPGGASLAPPPQEIVNYKGSAWTVEAKEEPSKPVPGSQICFLRNGKYQGVAFKDIYAGRYYPAASMYTLPNEPNCTVRFNFGPKFKFEFPNISSHPSPQPMSSARYCTLDGKEIEPAAVNTDQPDKSNDATQLSSEMAEPEKSENSGEYDLEKQRRSLNDQVISNSLVHVAVHSPIDITLNGQY